MLSENHSRHKTQQNPHKFRFLQIRFQHGKFTQHGRQTYMLHSIALIAYWLYHVDWMIIEWTDSVASSKGYRFHSQLHFLIHGSFETVPIPQSRHYLLLSPVTFVAGLYGSNKTDQVRAFIAHQHFGRNNSLIVCQILLSYLACLSIFHAIL